MENKMTEPSGDSKLLSWAGKYLGLNWLYEALTIDPAYVYPLVAIQLGYKNGETEDWGGRISLLRSESTSLFYNAAFYFRFCFPFWVGLGIRWAGKDETKREYFQFGIGWRLNGKPGLLFRFQSDAASAAGTTGPNYGQAFSWYDGTK
jgi:hypothetical protein